MAEGVLWEVIKLGITNKQLKAEKFFSENYISYNGEQRRNYYVKRKIH